MILKLNYLLLAVDWHMLHMVHIHSLAVACIVLAYVTVLDSPVKQETRGKQLKFSFVGV